MGLQLSVPARNARLDALETLIGPSPVLRLRTGAKPANCAAARSGTVVATMTLPADWMSNASAGVKALLGVWQDLLADAAGTIGHFEILEATATTCHIQGEVTITGGGGVMTVDNTVVELNQQITVTSFSLTDGNA